MEEIRTQNKEIVSREAKLQIWILILEEIRAQNREIVSREAKSEIWILIFADF